MIILSSCSAFLFLPWRDLEELSVIVKGQCTKQKMQAWPLPAASINTMLTILSTILLNMMVEIVGFLGNSGE